ncbi:MAG: hypothetical protein OEM46_12465, partial [Ignavibacteria bacterium]|nr:hypothetical protein [Ignavibacteria bacterium]
MLNFNLWKLLFPFILILCFSLIIKAQSSYLDWIIQGGSRSNDIAQDVYVDNFGFIYFVCEITDTTIFHDTTLVVNFSDVCLTKLNPAGEIEWIRLMGGTGLDRGLDIKTDNNDDIIVTGFFSGTATFGTTTLVSSGFTDVFVAKYNPNGIFQWVVHGAGSMRDKGLCIAIDDLNNIYVGGSFESTLQIGSYNLLAASIATMFYTKISPNGNVLWAEQAFMMDDGESFAESICFDGFDIVLTGNFDNTMIFDGDTLYSFDGSNDVFIAKIDITGNKVWLKQAGGDYDDGGSAIIVDDFGNIYLAGYFAHTANFGTFQFTSTDNNSDVFIAGLNMSGNFTWADHGSGTGYDYPTSISYNPTNGLSVCGVSTEGFEIGGLTFAGNATDDIFVANYSTVGNLINVLYTGGLGEERAFDIYLDVNNTGYVVGSFSGSMQMDDTLIVIPNNYLADMFVAKINFNNVSDIIDDKDGASLNNYILLQNYPNPFNPSTNIKFTIPSFTLSGVEGSLVTLRVYDVLGNEVTNLVNEELSAG